MEVEQSRDAIRLRLEAKPATRFDIGDRRLPRLHDEGRRHRSEQREQTTEGRIDRLVLLEFGDFAMLRVLEGVTAGLVVSILGLS